MSFIKKIQGGIKGGVDSAKFKADQQMRIMQVQGEINGLKQEISRVQSRIVGTTLELHKKNSLSIRELEELCVGIDELSKQIAQKDALVASIRAEQLPVPIQGAPVNPCPNCHTDVAFGAEFCTNCGFSMTQSVSPDLAGGSNCSECGASIQAGAAFCPNCGEKQNI